MDLIYVCVDCLMCLSCLVAGSELFSLLWVIVLWTYMLLFGYFNSLFIWLFSWLCVYFVGFIMLIFCCCLLFIYGTLVRFGCVCLLWWLVTFDGDYDWLLFIYLWVNVWFCFRFDYNV